jgi:hypothetical protein
MEQGYLPGQRGTTDNRFLGIDERKWFSAQVVWVVKIQFVILNKFE